MKAGSCLHKFVLLVSEKQKNYEIFGHFKYVLAQETTYSFL